MALAGSRTAISTVLVLVAIAHAASINKMLMRAEASFEKCYLELFGEKESEAL
jgi:hypothetical protein